MYIEVEVEVNEVRRSWGIVDISRAVPRCSRKQSTKVGGEVRMPVARYWFPSRAPQAIVTISTGEE